jgi:hypothetical protein
LIEVANAGINTFGTASSKANVSPSEGPIFVLTSSQLQEIITRAIQPLQDEVSQLKVTIVRQQEDIASLKSTEHLNFSDIRDLYTAIDEIDQRQQIKPQPLQKDRGEILRALLAAHGGKMLAKEARQKMHLIKPRFSELLATMKNDIEVRPYHLKKNQKVLVLK